MCCHHRVAPCLLACFLAAELGMTHVVVPTTPGVLSALGGLVADRGNNRIQVFDAEGNYLAQWKQFGKPSGLYIDARDTLYVGDGM